MLDGTAAPARINIYIGEIISSEATWTPWQVGDSTHKSNPARSPRLEHLGCLSQPYMKKSFRCLITLDYDISR
jgi:hypothetical protein